MMKLSYILFAFIFISCGLLMQGHTDTYKLINDTDHKVQVKSFAHEAIIQTDVIELDPHSSLSFARERGEGNDERTFFSVREIFTVYIEFDSEKRLILRCDDLTDKDCHGILRGDLNVIITEEDYKKAIPIE